MKRILFRSAPLVLFALILLTVILNTSRCQLQKGDPLKEAFVLPPDSMKPGVYWYFMD